MSSDYERSGIELDMVTDGYERGAKTVASTSRRIEQDLEGVYDASLRVDKGLKGIDGSHVATVDVVDRGINDVLGRLDDLERTRTANVTADDSQVQEVMDDLLGNLGADLIISTISGIPDTFESVMRFTGVEYAFQQDDSEGALRGRTNISDVPGAVAMADRLYVDNWGDSLGGVVDVITELDHLQVAYGDLEDAAASAFEVAAVTGEDVMTIIRTQDLMVRNGLSASYRDAADTLVTGYVNGANAGGDMFESFQEYASKFDEFGMDANFVMASFVGGMQEGAWNTDVLADSLNEAYIRLTDINDEAAIDAVAELGMSEQLDMFREGELGGEEFFSGITAALENIDSKSLQEQLARAIFGTKAEDIGNEVILAMNDSMDIMAEAEGSAGERAGFINDTVSAQLETLKRTFISEMSGFMDEAFDISGKIDTFKEQITRMFSELEAGENLLAAIEIAFEIDGLQQAVQDFRRGVTDLGIGILELYRDVRATLGYGTSTQDAQIADLGATALGWELGEADLSESIQGAIERAMDRGVDPEKIEELIAPRVQEAIAGGSAAAIGEMGALQQAFGIDLGLSFGGLAEKADIGNRVSTATNVAGAFGGITGFAMDAGIPEFDGFDSALIDGATASMDNYAARLEEAGGSQELFNELMAEFDGEVPAEQIARLVSAAQELVEPSASAADNFMQLNQFTTENVGSLVTLSDTIEETVPAWGTTFTTHADAARISMEQLGTETETTTAAVQELVSILESGTLGNFNYNGGGGTNNTNVTINTNSPAEATAATTVATQSVGYPP